MPKRNPVAHPTALQAPPQSSADSQWSRAPKLAESSPSTSAPNIALATLLVASVPTRIEIRRENLPVLPPSGFDGPIYTWQGLSHLILPALVLGLGGAGGLARYTRSSMLEVINNDYVRTARAKGLHDSNVIVRHALRNALIPVVTILGLSFGQILSGTVIVETVFAWPGIGRYLVSAISGRDFPAVQASVLLVAVSFVFANLATDLMLVYVDPRIRYE